jgi:hypothetical protein
MVYHVWLQRNNRIFDAEIKTEEQIVKAIRMDVKARMEGSKINSTSTLTGELLKCLI